MGESRQYERTRGRIQTAKKTDFKLRKRLECGRFSKEININPGRITKDKGVRVKNEAADNPARKVSSKEFFLYGNTQIKKSVNE